VNLNHSNQPKLVRHRNAVGHVISHAINRAVGHAILGNEPCKAMRGFGYYS